MADSNDAPGRRHPLSYECAPDSPLATAATTRVITSVLERALKSLANPHLPSGIALTGASGPSSLVSLLHRIRNVATAGTEIRAPTTPAISPPDRTARICTTGEISRDLPIMRGAFT